MTLISALMLGGTELKAGTAVDQLPAPPAAVTVPSVPAPAAPESARSALALVRSTSSKYWAKIDCLRDTAHQFVQEKYLQKSRHADPEIVAAFGSQFPQTSTFLLHYGGKWQSNTGKAVILLHGASDNATRAWAAPDMLLGDTSTPGLLQALEGKGYRVFAVTFPHKHGNLFYQAEHVASAIAAVKGLTGVPKVILIGHSAGGLAARAYVSGYMPGGFTAYRGDVEQLVTLAAPHGGQDFQFRHPEFNYYFVKDDLAADAPMSWDRILYYGQWKDTTDFSVYGPYFPMQQQVLRDWTGTYPVNAASQDWFTTYNGGQGLVSHSLGIKEAIRRGGNFISGLKNRPIDPEVSVAVLAGTDNKITNLPRTETDGPSDGLVFLESAADTEGMEAAGRTEPVKRLLVNANHLTITYKPEAVRLILSTLK